jgi:hypothetical protein
LQAKAPNGQIGVMGKKKDRVADEHPSIVDLECGKCKAIQRRFAHRCSAQKEPLWITGCPVCDDHCPLCETAPPNASKPPKAGHLCTINEVMAVLSRIRCKHGNVGVMVFFDGDGAAETAGEPVMPYLPVAEVAVDCDDPKHVYAVLCIAEDNVPFVDLLHVRHADSE